MKEFRQKYKEILHIYLQNSEEEALYKVHELCKQFVHEAIAPEELVVLHHKTVMELTQALPAEAALQIINRCLAYLLEVMVTYGINCGRGGYSWDNLNRWHEAVLHLSSSLNLFESKHKHILDTIPVGVISINREGKITFINKKIEEYLGIKAEDVLGKNLVDLCYGGVKKLSDGTYTSIMIETLETGKIFNDVEKEYPGGIVCQLSTSVIRDEAGEITEVISLLQNITQRKQLEQAIMRNEKLAAVGALAAGIAHEIRNPLTTIRGFIQLLHTELAQSQKKGYVDIIIEEIDRANSILNDFLCFSKPTPPKRRQIGVSAIMEEIRLLTESEALLREINLDFSCPMEIPGIYIDKDQIKQVLLNIVKNAFDAVAAHGRVKVAARWEPGPRMVAITVEDNGTGMDQQTVAKIFDPFFTTKESGTGLGMAVTYQIIHNHGGEINVESFPGRGTTFTILLPVAGSA